MKSLLVFFLLIQPLMLFGQSERDKAIDLYRNGDFAKAIAIFENLIELKEADYTSASYLGAAYVKVGKNKQAVDTFLRLHSFGSPKTPLEYDKKIKIVSRPIARCRGIGGSIVKLAVELIKDGTVGFVFPFSENSASFRESVIEAAREIKFEPAVVKGNAVTIVLVFEYRCDLLR